MESGYLNREIPFSPAEELNSDLQIIKGENAETQLRRTEGSSAGNTLPGNPFISLELDAIYNHLKTTITTPKLDKFAPHLWLVATPSSSSISPLHKQKILGREIIVTDTADLHLVWYHSQIFLKPLPSYLLSHSFWDYLFLQKPRNLRTGITDEELNKLFRATIGFIRTYTHLIQSPTDFHLALSLHLIPSSTSLPQFVRFSNRFKHLPDTLSSPRFHYGELRLTRLNFWSPIFLSQMHYFNMSRQYNQYFSRYFQPVLFAFGTFSLVLSAMQVGLAAAEPGAGEGSWRVFVGVSKWAAVSTIGIAVAVVGWLVGALVVKLGREGVFAVGKVFVRGGGRSRGRG